MAFAACSAPSQAPAPTPAAAPGPPNASATVNAEEVSLDLLARDSKGHLITDLLPSQIAVTDSGVPVAISGLHLVQGDSGSGHKVTLVYGRLDSAGITNARSVSAKMLKVLPEGLSFAVMNVGGRLRLLQKFTTDRSAISKGIAMATVEDKPNVAGNNEAPEKELITEVNTGMDSAGVAVPADDRASSKILLASLEESQRLSQDLFTQPTLSALLALARGEKDIAGRKVIIYFTEGFQMDANATDMVHSIVGAANRSGVTIYAVDLNALDQNASNGLMAGMAMGAALPGLQAAVTGGGAQGSTDHTPPGQLVGNVQTATRIEGDSSAGDGSPLGTMASSTGGFRIIANDSLKKPLQRLVEDMTTYYQASFVTPSTDFDGRFRPVHVASLRKDVALRYRAGYYALAPGSSSGIRPFEAPLLKMLADPKLPNDIAFQAQILKMGALQDGNANTVVMETPIEGLDVHEDSNTKLYSLHVSMVAQIKNKDGVVIDHFSEDLPRHGAIESLQGTRADVITLQRHFIAPPGQYVLEAAILDQNSQKAGAQRINFEIPETPAGLALSDMALVRKTDLFRVEADPLEPLHYGKAKVVPNVSGEVAKGSNDVSVFFIIHPDAAAAPIKLEMEVSKNGKTIGKMPLPVRSDVGPGVAVPYLGTLGARTLSPGRYEIAAILSQGEKSAKRTVSFTIPGGELASAEVPRSGVTGAPSPGSDADSLSDSPLPSIGAREASKLVITSPTNPIPAPTAEEGAAMIEGARARALHYGESLPNFYCVEVTTSSVDAKGKGEWKRKEEIAQLLKYRDETESRTMLERDGKKSTLAPKDTKAVYSVGQFGGVLNEVFALSSKAEFKWKETDVLGAGLAQVFTYRIDEKNSDYSLKHATETTTVASHGLVYIDANTLGVRRITLEADNIPGKFFIHASSIAVDYDYVLLNGHDYLMPIHAAISVRQGRHEGVLNELEFRDYRRFGSRVRMLGFTKAPTP